MKLTTLMPMVALGAKVPRDSPVRKILKLRRFANEWLINEFGKDSKVHRHWYKKVTQNVNRFKKRYENCGNTEVEYVAKVMADHAASLKEKEEQQVRKRRAKGGQGGSRGRGKGGKGGRNRPPKEAKIPTEFRKYDKSNAEKGIADIMGGFGIWSKRYVSKCKKQPATQETRADAWTAKLQEKLKKYNERSARQAARAAKN